MARPKRTKTPNLEGLPKIKLTSRQVEILKTFRDLTDMSFEDYEPLVLLKLLRPDYEQDPRITDLGRKFLAAYEAAPPEPLYTYDVRRYVTFTAAELRFIKACSDKHYAYSCRMFFAAPNAGFMIQNQWDGDPLKGEGAQESTVLLSQYEVDQIHLILEITQYLDEDLGDEDLDVNAKAALCFRIATMNQEMSREWKRINRK